MIWSPLVGRRSKNSLGLGGAGVPQEGRPQLHLEIGSAGRRLACCTASYVSCDGLLKARGWGVSFADTAAEESCISVPLQGC